MPDPDNTPGFAGKNAQSESAQILGQTGQASTRAQPIARKWRRFYEQLCKLRDEFIDATGDLRAKAREISGASLQDEPAEVGTENYLRDYLLGAASADQELLSEINEAISRIENGGYGICELTGEPIPEERLEAVPWARFTLKAEKELEARGLSIKASLGARGNLRERGTAPAGPRRDKEGSL